MGLEALYGKNRFKNTSKIHVSLMSSCELDFFPLWLRFIVMIIIYKQMVFSDKRLVRTVASRGIV